MVESQTILRFDNVGIDAAHGYEIGLRDVSLVLKNGELALVALERPYFHTPLADAASGLLTPEAGQVTFMDHDWRHCSPGTAARRRGQIGRVFDAQAWVSN